MAPSHIVLDEADEMVQEGGQRANSILIRKHMPTNCQSLLFSATFPESVVQFAEKMVGSDTDKILIEQGPEFLVSCGLLYFLYLKCSMSTEEKIHN